MVQDSNRENISYFRQSCLLLDGIYANSEIPRIRSTLIEYGQTNLFASHDVSLLACIKELSDFDLQIHTCARSRIKIKRRIINYKIFLVGFEH